MEKVEKVIIDFSEFIWGTPLLVLLLGGGFFFMIYSKLMPFRYVFHAVDILRGKYDDPNEAGQINHFQALSTALAATVGMGNISGVAVAITAGGPGAIFWMWVSAVLGVSTKFFTGTLAVMFRGKDDKGEVQGGPMYIITEGLGKKWKPMAVFFAVAAMFAVFPVFQSNQLTQVFRDIVLQPNGIETGFTSDLVTGVIIAVIMSVVIFGGIKRIGKVTGSVVPFMVVLYVGVVLYIILSHPDQLADAILLIFTDAFEAQAVLGGALGIIIITGIKRAAFSNEAGIGTAPLAHGAAKTNEPVREGLVAMLGPIVDTLIVCTMTALAILVTGVWQTSDADGITLTALAFDKAIPVYGPYLLILCVIFFALSTLFAFPYYGNKCSSYLFGTKSKNAYNVVSVVSAVVAAVVSIDVVIAFIDSAYALMAFPNMIAAIILAPHVKRATVSYFKRLKAEKKKKNDV
ncbi:sodium:alanine symporter family protein [Carboxylicivirga sp. M1479]|uniref:alanine/glycine:cation symporter family protein n=1 Tax=Carboxylicivirga sp. M1479 TaxID=2594476 RepID=UPI001177BAC3|nr:alanine/glycine:cation symporter family protein [Carboxylicivirga sp. M1479]TRX61679.1 alanine:cation symporter family protein [Carboxylicivirga sp. M1479]